MDPKRLSFDEPEHTPVAKKPRKSKVLTKNDRREIVTSVNNIEMSLMMSVVETQLLNYI